MKQTNKTLGIVFSALAGLTVVAAVVCIILANNAIKAQAGAGGSAPTNLAYILAIPFGIVFILFVFLGVFNFVRYAKDKKKFENRKY